MQILTYAIMSNHFHVLVRVPKTKPVSDAELLRRYAILYPKPSKYQSARLDTVKAQLKTNEAEAQAWRNRQLALMGDLSSFMRLVKQRFSIWFNRSHHRYGTLWAERFKSVLVEAKSGVLRTMAAYIDLNPVRSGLVSDPKAYRFCGYAEAVAGSSLARRGLVGLGIGQTWSQTQSAYREILFGKGASVKENRATISPAALKQVIKEKGRLPLATVLRCRIRYFSDGAVLGSQAFVQTQLAFYRSKFGPKPRTAPREIPHIADWGDLTTMRGLRKGAFG